MRTHVHMHALAFVPMHTHMRTHTDTWTHTCTYKNKLFKNITFSVPVYATIVDVTRSPVSFETVSTFESYSYRRCSYEGVEGYFIYT